MKQYTPATFSVTEQVSECLNPTHRNFSSINFPEKLLSNQSLSLFHKNLRKTVRFNPFPLNTSKLSLRRFANSGEGNQKQTTSAVIRKYSGGKCPTPDESSLCFLRKQNISHTSAASNSRSD